MIDVGTSVQSFAIPSLKKSSGGSYLHASGVKSRCKFYWHL